MLYAVIAIIGVAVGAAAGWAFARLSAAKETAEKVSGAESRASAAEGQLAVLREHAAKAAADFDKLRAELAAEKAERVRAETERSSTVRELEAVKEFIDAANTTLENTFKALSASALEGNRRTFLETAKESLQTVVTEAKGDLQTRQEAINGLVAPINQTLKSYQEAVQALELHRQDAYSKLTTQVTAVDEALRELHSETLGLVTALRKPDVRGKWGEVTLKRVVELAGMSDHYDFGEQVTSESDEGSLRPDMVVNLPSSRQIVIDAKAPLDAYLSAVSATSEEERQAHLKRHASQLRAHVKALSDKTYWKQFPTAPEFVVMFIPGESFFAAAVDSDRELIEYGIKNRVALATPTTLMALLRSVEYGWRQEKVARDAQEIGDIGRQLYERMQKLAEYLCQIGVGLNKAVEAYNSAVGSFEHRVFPAARRFKELGAVSGNDIPAIEPVETTPRKPAPPDNG